MRLLKIKVCDRNQEKIEKALKAVNGRKTAHTVTSYSTVAEIAQQFQRKLDTYLPKKYQKGACLSYTSGDSVASSYKYSRDATFLSLEKTTTGVFIRILSSDRIYEKGGSAVIGYTNEQLEIIKSRAVAEAQKF